VKKVLILQNKIEVELIFEKMENCKKMENFKKSKIVKTGKL
jgi:hypothetical protein